MSYIITDDKHYKDIANSIRSKMQTDREYYPEDMAIAVDNIPSSADGTDNPVIGIYYTNPDDNGNPTKVKISGWVNPTGDFPIMFTIDKVRSFIKEVEFLNCNFLTLKDGAFQNCISLKSISLPSSLTRIFRNTFNGCISLTSISLPSSLTRMDGWCFSNCASLTSISLPSSLIEIEDSVFSSCIRLTSISLPSSLIRMKPQVFNYCTSLKEVTLGENFNCDNLNLSSSTLYTRETILQWLNAIADRTGQTTYKLTIGATNLAKLTEEDILIATAKNWTLA